MIRAMIRMITGKYHLNAITLGEFCKIKANGMNFDIWAFHAEGLGHVSAMTATGLLGLVKMDTLIIDPTERDMPLYSYDRIQSRGNDTLICELYDTLLSNTALHSVEDVKRRWAALPDHDLGEHWYDSRKLNASLAKKGKKAESSSFDACAMEYLQAFLEDADAAPYCDPAEKKAKAAVYVDGLLEKGGSSTDVFQKSIGKEKTEFLFRHFRFGTTR